MNRRMAVAVAAACFLAAIVSTAQAPADLVELDVVVADKDGQSIADLKQEEIQIQDDGKKVEIKSFTPVNTEDGRSVVIILDDAGVPMQGTQPIQNLANIFLSGAKPGDAVTVLRLNDDSDTMSSEPKDTMARVSGFQAGKVPYDTNTTPERMLQLVVKAADHLGKTAHRRKAILCIGSPSVCNIEARSSGSPRDTYPNWVAATTALARSNTSVYAMIPVRMNLVKGGLTDLSGGRALLGTDDFAKGAAQIWNDLSHHYMIGYVPAPSTKELRKLEVKTSHKGGIVSARGLRGK